MKIGIIGTRGIPNSYGGFEQFAEYFSVFAAEQNHQVTVYCSSLHPNKNNCFNGVKRVICYDPENTLGTFGQFIYDLNCILDARKQQFDVILQLGYTSSSIWGFLMPKEALVVTNMDGMEWKRTKYNKLTRLFLMYAEKLAVKGSDLLIADSPAIAEYIKTKYNRFAYYVPYGAKLFSSPNSNVLMPFNLRPFEYFLVIARMEPENNIEMVIKGHIASHNKFPLIIVGSTKNNFGTYLRITYASDKIVFTEGIYQIEILNSLRYFSQIYFHGHSVGGTNPSLLEAMASHACIAAHNNEFNKNVLQQHALYFGSSEEVCELLTQQVVRNKNYIEANLTQIEHTFNWDKLHHQLLHIITSQYENNKII